MAVTFFGQSKLCKSLEQFSLDTFPNLLLLLGAEGCGKRTLARYLSDFYKVDLIEITNENYTTLSDTIYSRGFITFVSIDLRTFEKVQQNKLLKLCEDTPAKIKILLLANSTNSVLPTLINRSKLYFFEPYLANDLKKLSYLHPDANSLYYNICDNPGSFIENSPELVQKSLDSYPQLFLAIQNNQVGEILKHINTINFKDDFQKIPPLIYLKALNFWSVSLLKNFILKENSLEDNNFSKDTYDLALKLIDLSAQLITYIEDTPRLVLKNLFINKLLSIL